MPRFSQNTKVDALKRAPLFEDLSKKELAQLAQASDDLDVPAGKVLCREGDNAKEFFVILEGEVEVTKDGRLLSTCGPGDFVGEIALIANVPRTATVTAKTPLRFFVLTSPTFKRLVETNPQLETKVLNAFAKRVLSISDDPAL